MTKLHHQKRQAKNPHHCWIINSGEIRNFNPKRQEEVRMSIEEGKAAPAFTLPDANGKKVALKDFKGKNLVVYFYPKDDTPG
jgi:hypothetical protein